MSLALHDVRESDLQAGGFVERLFSGYGEGMRYPREFAYRDDAGLRADFIRRNAGSRCVRHWRADIDGVSAGFASLVSNTDGDALIENAVLLPAWRGRGYGRELFGRAVAAARERGHSRVFASVFRRDDSPSARICTGLGMRATHAKYRVRSRAYDPTLPGSAQGEVIVEGGALIRYRCIHYLVDRGWTLGAPTDALVEHLAGRTDVAFTDILTEAGEARTHLGQTENRLIFSMRLNGGRDRPA